MQRFGLYGKIPKCENTCHSCPTMLESIKLLSYESHKKTIVFLHKWLFMCLSLSSFHMNVPSWVKLMHLSSQWCNGKLFQKLVKNYILFYLFSSRSIWQNVQHGYHLLFWCLDSLMRGLLYLIYSISLHSLISIKRTALSWFKSCLSHSFLFVLLISESFM